LTVRQWHSLAFAKQAGNGKRDAFSAVSPNPTVRKAELGLTPPSVVLGPLMGSKVADLRQVPIVTDQRLPSSLRVRIPNRESRGSDSVFEAPAELIAAGVYDAQAFTSSFGWD
jgi:hypothetical protein